MPESS